MIKGLTGQSYVHLLRARASGCEAIEPGDRTIPALRSERDDGFTIGRGAEGARKLIEHDATAENPLKLVHGGEMQLFVRIRPHDKFSVEVTTYRVALYGLPDNCYNLKSLRYDWEAKPARELRKANGWDEQVEDNPEHPLAHLHLNYLPPGDRNCRLPTSPVCPILLICALNYWYCRTFGSSDG